jgi:hypothetical protein
MFSSVILVVFIFSLWVAVVSNTHRDDQISSPKTSGSCPRMRRRAGSASAANVWSGNLGEYLTIWLNDIARRIRRKNSFEKKVGASSDRRLSVAG